MTDFLWGTLFGAFLLAVFIIIWYLIWSRL